MAEEILTSKKKGVEKQKKMNKFFAIITIVIIGIVLVFFFLTDIRMSLVEMFFCVFACIAFPMKDHYDDKRDNHDNLLSGWVRVLSPVVVFLVLRYIWWPMHKNSLDAEVARPTRQVI